MRVEWLNCFNYFASIGIQGIQGATGKSGSGSTRLKFGGTSVEHSLHQKLHIN